MTVIGQVTLDLVHAVKAAHSTAEIAAILIRAGGIFGYEHFAIAGLPRSTGETLPDLLLMHWPAEWAARYVAQGYIRHDPVAAHVRRTTTPFLWSEVAIEHGAVLARRIMDEARAFGLGDGFCVPIHDVDGTESVASFGAPRMDLSEEARAGLHLLGIYAHLAARRLGPAEPARATRAGGSMPCRTRNVTRSARDIAGGTGRETSYEIRSVASGDPVGSLTQCGFRLRSDAA
ncbi:autoinducer binding domain-containing protein [Methylobacterium sp. 17Sr1-1]|uniref:autoinducer binding domain-containing protein n=1 Tax=Methylobacterium sp. 17Sr1-1 TaxID=2202826 RepID=UPI0013A57EE9|nr:autoinducer binding domain-containing protein [Methylobacterium sp. 17Sr1-1]